MLRHQKGRSMLAKGAITVLPADNSGNLRIEWIAKEEIGCVTYNPVALWRLAPK